MYALPAGFVYLDAHLPNLFVELSYAGHSNFVGRPICGYMGQRAILSQKATQALANVQKDLYKSDLGLKIFDAYRPKRSVQHFTRWVNDRTDNRTKSIYYPQLDKRDLFRLGYLAARSSHTRGSTVDTTLIRLSTGKELDMGSRFDFFGPSSWYRYRGIGPLQKANRKRLRDVMVRHGFKPYPKEWWHFTLRHEPFPRTYFNFPVR